MLKIRTISGMVILAVIFLSAFHLPVFGIWLLLILISSLGQLEFYRMVEGAGFPCFRVVGLICGALLISATFFTMIGEDVSVLQAYNWENFVLLFSLVAIFVRQFPQKHNDKPLETIACTLLGLLYVPYFFNYFTRLAFMWGETQSLARVGVTGRSVCLFAIVVVKFSDIGAYLVGRAIGRHKLFPRLSPKKTWEGLLGGIAFSVTVSSIIYWLSGGHLGSVDLRLRDVLVLGSLLPVIGVIGDIFESLIKRASGAKDSSAVIPGMGGVLDVLDSLLFTAPVMYVYAQVFWL